MTNYSDAGIYADAYWVCRPLLMLNILKAIKSILLTIHVHIDVLLFQYTISFPVVPFPVKIKHIIN